MQALREEHATHVSQLRAEYEAQVRELAAEYNRRSEVSSQYRCPNVHVDEGAAVRQLRTDCLMPYVSAPAANTLDSSIDSCLRDCPQPNMRHGCCKASCN